MIGSLKIDCIDALREGFRTMEVKIGQPDYDELGKLSDAIAGKWKKLARRLGFLEAEVTSLDKENEKLAEKAYKMLWNWKQREGSDGAYPVLYNALRHPLVGRYDLAKRFCLADVRVFVKIGQPDRYKLKELSQAIEGEWKELARCLGFREGELTAFDKGNEKFAEKVYNMLMNWKQREGPAGTYQVLYDALCHPYVGRKDLAERLCVADVRVLYSIPTYVRARSSKALSAYRKALDEGGSTYDARVKIFLKK